MAQEQLMEAYKAAVQAHQEQDLSTALAKYREVLKLNPGIAAVHNNVAAILLSQGEKRSAEMSWRMAVRLKSDYAEAHFNLAVLLSEKSDDDLKEAEEHCKLAIDHKENYTSAYHLMGNILMSLGRQVEAAQWYARAEGGAAAAAASGASSEGAPRDFRWDGVEVGHERRLQLPDGTSWVMRTLSLRPLVFLVPSFLSPAECERLIALARPRLKKSLVMGDASGSERTSESVFLGAAEDGLLPELQRRLAALAQLPLARVQASEDLQLVHYSAGATFGMHHDSSAFLPRYMTAFYYLSEVEQGGETAFPAADGAMSPDEAMALREPAAEGSGLVVKPELGAALLWYNHDAEGRLDPAAVHAGCRVHAGEKWGANHWVRLGQAPPPAAAATTGKPAGARRQPPGGALEEEEEEECDAGGDTGGGSGKNAAKNKKKKEKAAAKKRASTAGGGDPEPAAAAVGEAAEVS